MRAAVSLRGNGLSTGCCREPLVDSPDSSEPVAADLPKGRRLAEWLTATDDEVLIEQPGIHMLVRGTEEVLVDVDDGADTALLGPLLYGFVTRTLLLHAGTFCLHARVVRHARPSSRSPVTVVRARARPRPRWPDSTVPPCWSTTSSPHACSPADPRCRCSSGPCTSASTQSNDSALHDSADASVLVDGPRGKVAVPATQFGATRAQHRGSTSTGSSCCRSPTTKSIYGTDGPTRRPACSCNGCPGPTDCGGSCGSPTSPGSPALVIAVATYFEWSTELADALDIVNIVRPDGVDTLDEVCTAVLVSSRPRGDRPSGARRKG